MRAMVLEAAGTPLVMRELPDPEPGPGQVRLRVSACGVCRTDLHVLDGELADPTYPIVPGHQIVGTIDRIGPGVSDLAVGDRIGVPWLGHSCRHCDYCERDEENLCDEARFTGYHIPGGFAEYTLVEARYAFPLPEGAGDLEVAPLLCAGLIGYRALRMAGDAHRLGLYGFGAAAHILCQVAVHQGREVYAATRPGDVEAQHFARGLGATWAGGSDETPPTELDAVLIFAPVGPLLPVSLAHVRRGGTVVCAGIHMSDIPSFPYSLLWGERVVRSVANLTRLDGVEFLSLAPEVPVRTEVAVYSLEQANEALDDLRHGRFTGAAVLEIG